MIYRTSVLSRPRKAARATLAVGLLALALPVSNVIQTATATAAAPPTCGASGTPNVVALADPHYYIDSSSGLASTYAGYTVRTGTSAANQLWMKLSSFSGGVTSLAPAQPASSSLPNIAANSQATAYYLLQASAATTTPQTHTISLFSGNPDLGTLVCQRTFTYNGVFETIKALANKVTSVTVPQMAEATVGDLVTVTVVGATGTLGAGPSFDPGVLSYAPNALSSFPSGSWRLERTEIDISPDGVAPQQTYVNRLFLSGASGPNRNYTARYSFRATAPAPTATPVGPIQYIASGTQVKHTDVSGSVSGTLPSISSTANIQFAKAASPTTLTAAGGTVSYTVSIKNFGSSAGTVDRVVDTIPAGAAYVASSSKLNNRTITDPSISGSTLE